MTAFQLLAVAAIVVAVGHRGFAEPENECIILIRSVYSSNDGYENFVYSFGQLSNKKIKQIFAEPDYEENDYKRFERKLTYELVLDYFYSILNEGQIDISGATLPIPWCDLHAEEVANAHKFEFRMIDILVAGCKRFVKMLQISIEDPRLKHDEILKTLYEDWSYDGLTHFKGYGLQNEPSFVNSKAYFEMYTLGYFSYIHKVVKNENAKKSLQSVDNYCKSVGRDIIKEHMDR